MLYVKKDKLGELEKYGFKRFFDDTWTRFAACNAFGKGSEIGAQYVVNPCEKNGKPTGDYQLIMNAYTVVYSEDANDEDNFTFCIKESAGGSMDVIYDMIRDGVVEKR